jgi:RND family efflux transporter MFP subunit
MQKTNCVYFRRWLAIFACCSAAQSVAQGLPGYDCLIEPSMTVDLGSSIRGVAEEVLVKRGDEVEKGDILVQLESRVQQASVALAKARATNTAELASTETSMKLAKKLHVRLENLHKDGNVSQQMLDEAESEAFIAQSDWHRARENQLLAELELDQAAEILSMRTITSPISGIVVDRMLSPGELVTEDQVIMQLVNIDPLYVEVIMPAEEFGRVMQGSIATVKPAEPIGGLYEGRVIIVDHIIDAASGTFRIRVELPNADKALPAGLNCAVEFELATLSRG